MFYQASLQLFVAMNRFLEREDPLIAIVAEQMISFLKKLLGKFITITAIKAASNIVDMDYSRDKQLPGTYTQVRIALGLHDSMCRVMMACNFYVLAIVLYMNIFCDFKF